MANTQRALTRFRCGHCGDRLVMQTRHLGRLVACHTCGHPTHPVAGRLAGGQQQSKPPARGASRNVASKPARPKGRRGNRACANCGEAIGKLQLHRLWHKQRVCQPCYTRLAAEAVMAPAQQPPHGAPLPVTIGKPQHQMPGSWNAPASAILGINASPAVCAPPQVTAVPRRRRVAPEPLDGPAVLELSAAPLMPFLLLGIAGAGFFTALSVMSYVGGFVSALLLVGVAAAGVRWLRRGTSSVRARFEQIADVRRREGSPRVIGMLAAWLWSQPAGRLPFAVVLLLFWGAMYVPYRLGSLLQLARRRPPAPAV